eukprot:3412730-Pleurochrysis_carterae.AAC.1
MSKHRASLVTDIFHVYSRRKTLEKPRFCAAKHALPVGCVACLSQALPVSWPIADQSTRSTQDVRAAMEAARKAEEAAAAAAPPPSVQARATHERRKRADDHADPRRQRLIPVSSPRSPPSSAAGIRTRFFTRFFKEHAHVL